MGWPETREEPGCYWKGSALKVTGVECTVLLSPDGSINSANTSREAALVQVYTDAGITGLGEVESNSWVIKALIEAPGSNSLNRGLGELLVGQDPMQPHTVWEHLYAQSLLIGRRGVGIGAIGAIDIAIWDIYGKATGKPIWQLLGGACQEQITPYASLLPAGGTLKEYRDNLLAKAAWARDFGFKAAKMEILIKGPLAAGRLSCSDDDIVELVADCRGMVGPQMAMMVDVGYCWNDWKDALRAIQRMEKYEIKFVETPLPSDDLDGYARLSDAAEVPIAAGELLNTRFEFADLMDRGRVDIVQPDVGRVGGITEAMRVVQMAVERGKLMVPHCWSSGIGIAATAHVAAASPNCPFIEFLPAPMSDSQIRRELVIHEPELESGMLRLPRRPGLGVELNRGAIAKFTECAAMAVAGVKEKQRTR